MCKIGLFGGTAEGRALAEYMAKKQIQGVVYVTSQYAADLLPESETLTCHIGPLDQNQMEQQMKEQGFSLVIDATHPYAVQVTPAIQQACQQSKTPYVRCLRDRQERMPGQVVTVETATQAAAYLAQTEGNILLTTGSKELSVFCKLVHKKERLYARVLPDVGVVQTCGELGLLAGHLICMQGPFDKAFNQALYQQWKIAYLVTKETGSAGGFSEKLEAAADCGVTAVVIGRPLQEQGESLCQVMERLEGMTENRISRPVVSLVGVGPGNPDCMSPQARAAIDRADSVLAPARLLQAFSQQIGTKQTAACYLSDEVLSWLKGHLACDRVAVLCTGDTGFYSSAVRLTGMLAREGYEFELIPGISSVSYFSARIQKPWQDVYLCSGHGREIDILTLLKQHHKLFMLLGGTWTAEALIACLNEGGLGDCQLWIGERLSYREERIVASTAKALAGRRFDSLAIAYVEKRQEDHHG